MHAKFSYTHFEWLFNFHTDQFYGEIAQFMKQDARKKVGLFGQ